MDLSCNLLYRIGVCGLYYVCKYFESLDELMRGLTLAERH